MSTPLAPAVLRQALSYPAYRALTDERFAEGRTTSADPAYNTPAILEYARINLARMNRLDKLPLLEPATIGVAQALPRPLTALVLTESWCGDAAQIVPVLHRIADASAGRLTLRLLLRDEHPALMDQFLTNGGRSIPKLLLLDAATHAVLSTWGPRPTPAQTLVQEALAAGLPYEERNTRLHTWYAQDKTLTTQTEIRELLGRLPDNEKTAA
ncbi:MAG: thioredoxin family protein [Hymenobacteraceae bacterium]|nr:thioredoxin family protein [Hymenobacteraceae bacterium]